LKVNFFLEQFKLLSSAIDRPCHRIIKIARIIADLAEAKQIATSHVAEAVQYRQQQYEVR